MLIVKGVSRTKRLSAGCGGASTADRTRLKCARERMILTVAAAYFFFRHVFREECEPRASKAHLFA